MTVTAPAAPPPLSGSSEALAERHDVALLDLDGVVYLGQDAVPGAASALATTVERGLRLGFVTNNASRSPAAVAEQLTRLGVPARPEQVITSSQTAARVLAGVIAPGALVLIVGTDALADQIRVVGLTPTRDLAEPVAAVVQGFSPDTGWADLAAATRAIRDGARWIATNADATVPSVHGPLPGNGAFVQVVVLATGARPQVTGKPEPSMHAECVDRLRARRPLVVGDRLDTDIEGAARAGCPSLLVFTGVTRPGDLLVAVPEHRPTYLAADLTGLLIPHPEVEADDQGWRCDGWRVSRTGELTRDETDERPDPWSALRALCVGAWATGDGAVRPGDEAAATAFATLGLTSG